MPAQGFLQHTAYGSANFRRDESLHKVLPDRLACRVASDRRRLLVPLGNAALVVDAEDRRVGFVEEAAQLTGGLEGVQREADLEQGCARLDGICIHQLG